LADLNVFVMPGSLLGARAYFRISLTASDEMVERAVRRSGSWAALVQVEAAASLCIRLLTGGVRLARNVTLMLLPLGSRIRSPLE
jgi:hypothetical protein